MASKRLDIGIFSVEVDVQDTCPIGISTIDVPVWDKCLLFTIRVLHYVLFQFGVK